MLTFDERLETDRLLELELKAELELALVLTSDERLEADRVLELLIALELLLELPEPPPQATSIKFARIKQVKDESFTWISLF